MRLLVLKRTYNCNLQVVEPSRPSFILQDNVFASNRHLMGTDIFRHLLYTLKNISFLGCFKDPSTTSNEWEPWRLVHKRHYSPKGFYYVRLFYLGKWRRITVDDYLPTDCGTDKLLVPFISPHQLWLPLLCKAVLVVASLSDFDWRRARFSNLLTGGFSYCHDRWSLTEQKAWEWVDTNVPHRKEDTVSKETSASRDSNEAPGSETFMESDSVAPAIPGYERYVLMVVGSAAFSDLKTRRPVNVEIVVNQCFWRKYAKSWKEIRYNEWAYKKGSCLQLWLLRYRNFA